MTNTEWMNNHKLKAEFLCVCAMLEATCYIDPVGVWCTVFPHGLPGNWFLLATCKPGPLKAAKTKVSVSFTSFPTTRFRLLRMTPKERKNVVDLFAGAFQKTTADFIQLFMLLWFVLKMVWIILYHAVSFCTQKKRVGLQQFHDTTSKLFSNNFGQPRLSQPEAMLSPPC